MLSSTSRSSTPVAMASSTRRCHSEPSSSRFRSLTSTADDDWPQRAFPGCARSLKHWRDATRVRGASRQANEVNDRLFSRQATLSERPSQLRSPEPAQCAAVRRLAELLEGALADLTNAFAGHAHQ